MLPTEFFYYFLLELFNALQLHSHSSFFFELVKVRVNSVPRGGSYRFVPFNLFRKTARSRLLQRPWLALSQRHDYRKALAGARFTKHLKLKITVCMEPTTNLRLKMLS